MFRPATTPTPAPRRGVILLVVIALLTLFAVVGISFVMYAQQRADVARVLRESQQTIPGLAPNDTAQALLKEFAANFIFGQADNITSTALRGHELARGIYGYNANDPNLNITPYNGTGRLHHIQTPLPPMTGGPADEYYLVNYTYFQNDGFLHDPERFGWRPNSNAPLGPYAGGFNAPYTYPDLNTMCLAVLGNTIDQNGNPTSTMVLQPSFHRSWTGFGPLGPTNPNWYLPDDSKNPQNKALKYMVLRPRPADMGPGFPAPGDDGGDVRNLPGNGPNDSIWLDLGSKVQTLEDGRKYKALYAPLIIDLDGRINLNVAGNLRAILPVPPNPPPPSGVQYGFVSNQGWGPWEVDVSQVLNAPGTNNEWVNLFVGADSGQRYIPGRYGSRLPYPAPPQQPKFAIAYPTANSVSGTQMTPLFSMPRYYAQVDFDASNESNNPPFTGLSGQTTVPNLPTPALWPTFGNGYGNNNLYSLANNPNAPQYELVGHPALYNVFQPGGNDRTFDVSANLPSLLLLPDTAQTVDVTNSSDLGKLCPTNFSSFYLRRLVTTYSFDVDLPGVTPWIWDPGWGTGAPQALQFGLSPFDPTDRTTWSAKGPASPFPPLPQITTWPPQLPAPPPGSEFGGDWRAVYGRQGIGRIDLNRQLPDYPQAAPGQPQFIDPNNAALVQQFNDAQLARQKFAADIFVRLVKLTGAYDLTVVSNPPPPAPTRPQIDVLRWLAQLSVNIVDYIDPDDYMTPFRWSLLGAQNPSFQNAFVVMVGGNPTYPMDPVGKGYVLGTELPRVSLNEAYSEIANDTLATNPFNVNFWVELLNTFNNNAGATNNTYPDSGTAILEMNSSTGAAASFPATESRYPIYQVVIARRDTNSVPFPTNSKYLRAPENVTGELNSNTVPLSGTVNYLTVSDYTADPAQVTPPPTPVTNITTIAPGSAFVLGPKQDMSYAGPSALLQPTLRARFNPTYSYPNTPTITYTSGMSYTLPNGTTTVPPTGTLPNHIVLLRRLACPYMRPQPNPDAPNYNPYITVDSIDDQDGVPTPAPTPSWPALKLWNAVTVVNGGTTTADPLTGRYSVGRVQPFAGQFIQWQTPATLNTNQPQHTFGTTNAPIQNVLGQSAFDWLVHADRQLISPMELLHVSAFRPHELMRQFMRGQYTFNNPTNPFDTVNNSWTMTNGGNFNGALGFGHRSPWTDQDLPLPTVTAQPFSHRLYRLFEFVETRNRMAGMPDADPTTHNMGGRIPGKVNINTMWDQRTLQALCAALPRGMQGPNNFDQSDVAQIFTQLVAQRTLAQPAQAIDPNTGQPVTTIAGVPGQFDRPFLSLAAGLTFPPQPPQPSPDPQYPAGLSVENTLLRSFNPAQGGRRLLELPDVAAPTPLTQPADQRYHPYIKDQLLTKIYNNLTTRSNVFAVWVTVGFFTVTDESTQPVKLGSELGLDLGQNVRHHLFAIIDRSALTMPILQFAKAPNLVVRPPTSQSSVNPGSGFITASTFFPPQEIPAGVGWKAVVQPGAGPVVSIQLPFSVPKLQAGSIITVDDKNNRETVVVQALNIRQVNNQYFYDIQANFKKKHDGSKVPFNVYWALPGNPGPQNGTFDPDTNTALVPFYTILD